MLKAIDHFFKIGSTHKVCEDYIISGGIGTVYPGPYVIIADGCSSSDNTDMGARILAHSALKYLTQLPFNDNKDQVNRFGHTVIQNADSVAHKLNIDRSCLDATLIVLTVFKNVAHVFMFGDGAVIEITDDDVSVLHEVTFNRNAPYYLSYKINHHHWEYIQTVEHMTRVRTGYSKFLGQQLDYEVSCQLEIADFEFSYWRFNLDNSKGILICSDGISSFIHPNGTPVANVDIINEITNFKNINGEFIKRRMGSKKGALNTLAVQGITHYDDLSIGGIIKQ